MKALDFYKRNQVDKEDCITTGVSIRRDQKTWIEKNELNLSHIVRDAIDSLMTQKGTKTEKD